MVHIALIIGSTRPERFADIPARWMAEGATDLPGVALETLDLRDYPMPFYGHDEAAGSGPDAAEPVTSRWKAQLARFDAFIFTVAEYNHGPTAVLKNALDHAGAEWNNKPVAFVAYGGVGGSRAVEQLRQIVIELQMAPIKQSVFINMEPFRAVRGGASLDSFEHLMRARTATFEQLLWWARALQTARQGSPVG